MAGWEKGESEEEGGSFMTFHQCPHQPHLTLHHHFITMPQPVSSLVTPLFVVFAICFRHCFSSAIVTLLWCLPFLSLVLFEHTRSTFIRMCACSSFTSLHTGHFISYIFFLHLTLLWTSAIQRVASQLSIKSQPSLLPSCGPCAIFRSLGRSQDLSKVWVEYASGYE